MEFIYQVNQDQRLKKLMQKPEVEDLLRFLMTHEGSTLREIKIHFPTKGIETAIDDLVEKGIIERKDRRYRTLFPIMEAQPVEELLKQVTTALDMYSYEEQLFLLGEVIWPLLFPSKSSFFYGSQQPVPLWQSYILDHADIKLVTISKETGASLPEYFALQQLGIELTETVHQQLEQTIGDVDPVYYMDQIAYLIRKMEKGAWRPKQANIFADSLFVSNVAEQTIDGAKLLLPVAAKPAEQPSALLATLKQLAAETPAAVYHHTALQLWSALLTQNKLPHVSYLLLK